MLALALTTWTLRDSNRMQCALSGDGNLVAVSTPSVQTGARIAVYETAPHRQRFQVLQTSTELPQVTFSPNADKLLVVSEGLIIRSSKTGKYETSASEYP